MGLICAVNATPCWIFTFCWTVIVPCRAPGRAVLARALPPNVYQIHHGLPPDEIRAKYALLSLAGFERAVSRDFHSYFWARFAQPCGILYCRDEQVEQRVIEAICQACTTFYRRVVPALPDAFDAKNFVGARAGAYLPV